MTLPSVSCYGDVAVAADPQDAVVVSVGDEESAAVAVAGRTAPRSSMKNVCVRGDALIDQVTEVGDHPEACRRGRDGRCRRSLAMGPPPTMSPPTSVTST